MNISLTSLKLQHISKSPLIVGNRITACNMKVNNIISPIFYNQHKLLLTKSTFANSVSPAVYSSITINQTILHPLHFSISHPLDLTIDEASFANFKFTSVVAKSDLYVEGTNIKISNSNFQNCFSPQEGGCLYIKFESASVKKICCDSCSSEKRGHFLYNENTNMEDNRMCNLFRTPVDSPGNSAIYTDCLEGKGVAFYSFNISNSNTPKAVSAFTGIGVKCPLYAFVISNNTGKSNLKLVSITRGLFTGLYFINCKHTDAAIIFQRLKECRITRLYITGCGSNLFNVTQGENNSVAGEIDTLPTTSGDIYMNNTFSHLRWGRNVTIKTPFEEVLPDKCIITPQYQRPDSIKILFGVAIAINAVVLIVCAICIIFDVRRMLLKPPDDFSSGISPQP